MSLTFVSPPKDQDADVRFSHIEKLTATFNIFVGMF